MNTSNVDHHDDEPPAELISGVLNDARDYAVAEVDKLKAEAITQVKSVGEELKIISVALLLWAVGAGLLGAALAFGLSDLGLPNWAAFGIVALVFGALGAVCLNRRKSLAKP